MQTALKILLLADAYSEHTERWALGLAQQDVSVGVFSFNKASYPWYSNHENIELLFEPKGQLDASSNSGKLSYLKYINPLKKAIHKFCPDVLHAHYATSYGLIGALSGFHPFVISAWGTDVMKFPQKNFINKAVLKYNLNKADALCATSFTIREYLKSVTSKTVDVVSFGVDIEIFKKRTVKSVVQEGAFVFGSVKALETLYNIDVLIRAFGNLKMKYPEKNMKLLIIGEGSQESNLKKIASNLNISNHIIFTGRIAFSQVADYYNMLNVLVNISDYESFGVSVIEAMACEKPVIVTNTGGLREIVENSNFGSLVDIRNEVQTMIEMERYLLDEPLSEKIGQQGREKVKQKYNWNNNIQQMIAIYLKLAKK